MFSFNVMFAFRFLLKEIIYILAIRGLSLVLASCVVCFVGFFGEMAGMYRY